MRRDQKLQTSLPTLERDLQIASSLLHKKRQEEIGEQEDNFEYNKLMERLKQIRLKEPEDRQALRLKASLEYSRKRAEAKRKTLVGMIKELRSLDSSFMVTQLGVRDGDFDRLMDLF